MDFPSNNWGLSDSDLSRVFKYQPDQETAVWRRLTTDPEPVVWSHSSPKNWQAWLQHSCPSNRKSSGLALLLARKRGEAKGSVQQILDGTAKFISPRTDTGFKESFNEKNRSYSWPKHQKIAAVSPGERRSSIDADPLEGGSQDVRNVPFGKETFREICKKFFIHPSIAKVISRADVPLFSRARVEMGSADSEGGRQLAYVYNCRSSNEWQNDLALTVTYFPESKMTFGIFFGCTAAIETQILNRLGGTEEHAFHPMLLPGIFAELERTRMVSVVDATIDEIEREIRDLDTGIRNTGLELPDPGSDEGKINIGTRDGRRKVWLNTTFLRSRLQIWKTQMAKMIEHVDELMERGTSYTESEGPLSPVDHAAFKETSRLIKDRLQALIEEFQDKMEECTTSIDGMTIATQWSQADINVDIATVTGQDSSQMRSIALVTMLFLPGTFVATLFSMTFFNWNSSGGSSGGGSSTVSTYIWIYFLVTGILTLATLLAWWYFMGRRRGLAASSKMSRQCC